MPGRKLRDWLSESLQRRFLAFLCAGGIIAIVIGATLTALIAEWFLHRQMEERGRLIATALNHMSMTVADWSPVQHVVGQLGRTDEIEAIVVMSATDHRAVAAYPADWRGMGLDEIPDRHLGDELNQRMGSHRGSLHTHKNAAGDPILTMIVPLHKRSIHGHAEETGAAGQMADHDAGSDAHVRGTILVRLNKHGVEVITTAILWTSLASLVLVAAVTILMVAFILKRDTLRRVRTLHAAIRSRADDRMGRPAPDLGRDEIGRIATSYNKLLEALDHREDSLKATTACLEEALEEAHALGRAKSEFLANMSHELRTPLNAVIGFAEALKANIAGALNDKQEAYVGHIHNSGRHLLHLVDNLLDFTRIDSGKLVLHETEVDVAEVLAEAVTMTTPSARARDIDVSCMPASDLPPLWADRHSVIQVVLNLLSNAIKFSPHGGRIVVTASREHDLVVAVSDFGPGIPPEQFKRVFEPFCQAERSDLASAEGTGLGLAIVKSLVEAHCGQVEIDSRVGEGTTVRVRMPAERVRPPRQR